jgi:hypothetical protein
LDDATASGGAHVRKHGADELNAGGQVGGEDGGNLLVGEFLGGAEHAVARVADQDIDPPEVGDGTLDDRPQCLGVADVEHLDAKEFGELLAKIGDRPGLAHGADNVVTLVEQLLGEVSAEAATDSGDKPDTLCHSDFPCFGAISLRAASPLSVRGYPMNGRSWVSTASRVARSLPTLRLPAT